ncbi:MAG: dUTP diphosphatase [Candidatus Peregrinibacteria bacterium]
MKIRIHRLPHALDLPLPAYQTAGSVAFDFFAAEETIITPGEIALVKTGLVIETPAGYALIIASRSSSPLKKGITPPHGIGVIDHDYCGPEDEIKVQVRNFTKETVTIARGERIAQGFFIEIEKAEWEEFTPVSESRGGFGSTGH